MITILAHDDWTATVIAFSCQQNKTFEGICLALPGKFVQKGVVNSFGI